jgi:hypothetical protein
MKPVIITRKIQLLLQAESKEEWKEGYGRLLAWQSTVSKAANRIVTHLYVQEHLPEMVYLTEGAKAKLADAQKDADGILTTSRTNSTYRLLSAGLKGEIPMSIIGALNSRIVSIFNKEKGDYAEGKRSLRTYRRDQPIPVVSAAISSVKKVGPEDAQEYELTLFGLRFRTNFGRDASGNRQFFSRLVSGEYRLRDSSLQVGKSKLFLLAVFNYEKGKVSLSADLRVEASLSIDAPIIAVTADRKVIIGSREEYLHRRLAIQEAMHRTQSALAGSRGGKGRKKKLRALKRYEHLEKNYVRTRLHQYAARLIDLCRSEGAGTLVLKGQTEKAVAAQDEPFLLRNWGYYGLIEKIRHKAAKYEIKVLIE